MTNAPSAESGLVSAEQADLHEDVDILQQEFAAVLLSHQAYLLIGMLSTSFHCYFTHNPLFGKCTAYGIQSGEKFSSRSLVC